MMPDIDGFYNMLYGAGYGTGCWPGGDASGRVWTGNPGYTAADFLAMYPKFSILPSVVIQAYLNIANASLMSARWQEAWQLAMGLYIAHFCTLYARSDAQDVISTLVPSIHSETPDGDIPGTVYTLTQAPPGGVLMGLYIAGSFLDASKYTLSGVTLTLNTPTNRGDSITATWPTQTAITTQIPATMTEIAARGIALGVMTSKSVGDVSASYQTLQSIDQWAAWTLTLYGQQLVTWAKTIGAGPVWVR